MFPTLLVTALISLVPVYSLDEDYYWRDFNGSIPVDAILAGIDSMGKKVYIGQAYYKDGIFPVEIFKGEPFEGVNVPANGIVKVEKNIKILCGDERNFYWEYYNNADLHVELIGKHPVIGGYGKDQIWNIGRIKYNGGRKIGKVDSWLSKFYFDNGHNKELVIKTFQILLYKFYSGYYQ